MIGDGGDIKALIGSNAVDVYEPSRPIGGINHLNISIKQIMGTRTSFPPLLSIAEKENIIFS